MFVSSRTSLVVGVRTRKLRPSKSVTPGGSLRVGWRMQPHEKQDQEPDSPKRKKPDPRDTQAKWLLFAIAILLGLITAQIIKRLV